MNLKFIIFIIAMMQFSCKNSRENTGESQNQDSVPRTSVGQPFNSCLALGGKVFTYLSDPEIKEHLFTLKFDCVHDSLIGVLLGPLPMEEHGLFFYKAELTDLKVGDSLAISFSMTPGLLYKKQITIENYRDILEGAGTDKGEQFFKGRILSDTVITLTCSSEVHGCFTNEEMTFLLAQ